MKNITFNSQSYGDHILCEKILKSLPEWFGVEKSLKNYVEKSKCYPMLIVEYNKEPIGFISLKSHGKHTSEVFVMGLLPDYHRRGFGKMLLQYAENYLSKTTVKYLQVKTVSSDRNCKYYTKTRLFYEEYGFMHLEVFPDLWDKSNPCLLLVKNIESHEYFNG